MFMAQIGPAPNDISGSERGHVRFGLLACRCWATLFVPLGNRHTERPSRLPWAPELDLGSAHPLLVSVLQHWSSDSRKYEIIGDVSTEKSILDASGKVQLRLSIGVVAKSNVSGTPNPIPKSR